jgi:hypothetical protein
VTRTLADSAIKDRVGVRFVAEVFLINLFEFLSGFEFAVVFGRRFQGTLLFSLSPLGVSEKSESRKLQQGMVSL